MRNLLFWILFYTLALALSQILLKLGINRMGSFSVQNTKDTLLFVLAILKNPYILTGTALMASSFFLWLFILSWFKLSLVFPLTAFTYIFVALLSYYLLGEKLFLQNYIGIIFMAIGVFFLLLK